ncbi:hypothetical protein WR25_07086 isoform B [Diploscapter pachys]|uniref:DNTTIP1 dimerisation domain-containing protein n=1 Tax=Diploscapter pachys TaxID=2018661 RepID=A0A2A2LN21_9BILA|nr:hypothetical protein WR25_07086 isoform B [Diploscapter pachys]
MYERGQITGNGNGNKMNVRLQILDSILQREMEVTVDTGGSARVNSLKQVIKKNKTDIADTPGKSLDLMRKVYQNEITREIHQILERYMNANFMPAIENLKRNGHTVDEGVINQVLVNILEAAKKPYMKQQPERPQIERFERDNHKRGYESDESDISIISHSSESKRRRGRPRKEEEYTLLEMAPVTEEEVIRWNPERFHFATRFVPAVKVILRVFMSNQFPYYSWFR